MESMLGISLYSYPTSTSKNALSFFIIAYVFSSTKLEVRAEQVLLGSKRGGRESEGAEGRREKWPKHICTCE
jgi:hypothetical protein